MDTLQDNIHTYTNSKQILSQQDFSKWIILDFNELQIPRLDQKNKYDKYYGIGWYSFDNKKIKYKYEIDAHRFLIEYPLQELTIQYVPYTTGKYEEEEVYNIHIEYPICKIYHRPNKFVDYQLNKKLYKSFVIYA